VVGGPPDVLAHHIRQELKKWREVVTAMGLHVQ
jgi:hypothetical protein